MRELNFLSNSTEESLSKVGPRHQTFFNNLKNNNAINLKLCNNY